MVTRAAENQKDLTAALEARVALVDKAGKHGEHEIVGLGQGLSSIAELLRRTTSESATQAEQVIKSFREGGEALAEVSRRTALQISGVKLAVDEQLRELTEISTQVAALAQSVRSQLQSHAQEVASVAAERTPEHLGPPARTPPRWARSWRCSWPRCRTRPRNSTASSP